MATFHFKLKNLSRSKGHSAVDASAYRACECLWNDRAQKIVDYRRRLQQPWHKQILAPETAPEWVRDREKLWNQAEAAEIKGNARVAREIELALPAELSKEQQKKLVLDFVQRIFVRQGMVADVFLFLPKQKDSFHYHAQVLLTTRAICSDGFSKNKNRYWGCRDSVFKWREMWAKYANHALEQAGSSARIDHRTLKAQGIDREPTKPRKPPKRSKVSNPEINTPHPASINSPDDQLPF